MDIDDEYCAFVRLVHPDLTAADEQFAIMRNAFFAGMMASFAVLDAPGNAWERLRIFQDVQRQLAEHVARALAGKEPGFTDTDFGR